MSTLTPIFDVVSTIALDVALLVEYGSRAYGTANENSDRDLLGVYMEQDHEIYGIRRAQTQVFRLSEDGSLTQLVSDHDPRACDSDVEMVFHPLRKYVTLAAAGNPSVLGTLWSTQALTVLSGAAGEALTQSRRTFLSKHAGYRHAGYARAQRERLLTASSLRVTRPELIARHGFDTKYATHLIRLLFAGLDLVRERAFHLPMKPEHLEQLGEIRRGEVPLEDILTLSEKLEHDLTTETEDSDLPDEVDFDAINDLLVQLHHIHIDR